MPGFDKTGPMGQGPMTGRRMGKCTNFGASKKTQIKDPNENPFENDDNNSENTNFGFGLGRGRGGRGFGFGKGGGRGLGRRNRFRGGNN